MLIQVCVCIQRDSRVRVYFSSGLWVRFVLADFTRASRVVADRERREANAREFIDGFTDAEGLEYFRDAFCRRMRERERVEEEDGRLVLLKRIYLAPPESIEWRKSGGLERGAVREIESYYFHGWGCCVRKTSVIFLTLWG